MNWMASAKKRLRQRPQTQRSRSLLQESNVEHEEVYVDPNRPHGDMSSGGETEISQPLRKKKKYSSDVMMLKRSINKNRIEDSNSSTIQQFSQSPTRVSAFEAIPVTTKSPEQLIAKDFPILDTVIGVENTLSYYNDSKKCNEAGTSITIAETIFVNKNFLASSNSISNGISSSISSNNDINWALEELFSGELK